jgi:hypothetical protein
MKYILFFFVSISAFAQNDCPSNTLAMEYVSPVSGTKKITCGYMKDGKIIKHGPEKELDASGKISKYTMYEENQIAEVKPAAPAVNEDESFAVLGQLLKILTIDKVAVNDGKFKVHNCDSKPKEWAMAAITGKTVSKSYAFADDNCDVSGSFTASFKDQFPVSFNLRNLNEFTKTSMQVKMNVKQASGVRYMFDVLEGSVTGDGKSISFNSHYEVNINPMTGKALFDTQEGTVTLLKVDNKVLNIARPIRFGGN